MGEKKPGLLNPFSQLLLGPLGGKEVGVAVEIGKVVGWNPFNQKKKKERKRQEKKKEIRTRTYI